MDMLGLLTDDGNGTWSGCWCSWPPARSPFCIMAVVRVQGSVRRRAANIGRADPLDRSGGSRSLRHSSMSGRAAA